MRALPSLDGLDLIEELHAHDETVIWRGVRRSDGARVIVKSANAATVSASTAARLRHEARVLQRLTDAPGVVRLLEARETPRGPCLLLPDNGLAPLGASLARGPLALATALRVGEGIARALDALHRRDVVHRDVKPDNVLASPDGGRVEIIDLGVASWLQQDAAAVDAVEGTLAYIAPEQTGRTGRAVDGRADLYALGVTLYELLAGRRPFDDADPVALMHAHIAVTPPSLDAIGAAPAAVAAIVARLLEKDPDARYQTAAGVAADLARASDALSRAAEITPFPLGEKDFVARVRLPRALVGRDDERAAIADAWARASAGGREVVLLAGVSGSGKTALARTVRTVVAGDDRSVFLAGKHDQLARGRPYPALSEAFGAYCARVAAAPGAVLARFAGRARHALGPTARLLADVMRELTWVTGPLPEVDEVSPHEQQNRLALAWRNLARAVRDDAGGGLALFLDDVQWADPATLSLLGDLAGEVEGCLLLLSFRSDEVGPEHPLHAAVARASSLGARVTRIDVGDLDAARVGLFVRAALPGAAGVDELAERVWRRTGGNPFFVGQLLLALNASGALSRDADSGAWRWDLDALDAASLGDDVVALVTSRLRGLPAETRRALGVAACVGGRFELASVVTLLQTGVADAVAALAPALELGVVVAEDARARAAFEGASLDGGAWLRFLHDRVQQAAWEGLDPDARARAHLTLSRRSEGDDGAARFERARHGVAALAVIDDPAERAEVARRCLEAAVAARAAGAFESMDGFAEGAAAALAGSSAGADVAVALLPLRVHCDVLMRRFDAAERRAMEALAGDLPQHVRLRLYGLRLDAAMSVGDFDRARSVARDGLAEAGVVAPEGEALMAATQAVFGEVVAAGPTLFGQDPDAYFSGPYTETDASRDFLSVRGAFCAALSGHAMLAAYWIAEAARGMLRDRRATPFSPMLFVGIGQILTAFSLDYAFATRWIRLGADLAERKRAPVRADCAVQAAHVLPHHESVERTIAAYERAIALAFEQGAIQSISWGTAGTFTYGYAWRGEALATLRVRATRAQTTVRRAGDSTGELLMDLILAFVDALSSAPPDEAPITQDLLGRGGPRRMMDVGVPNAAAIARPYECLARYVHGHYDACLANADEAEVRRGEMFALPTVTDVDLWLGLASARAADALEGEARAARVALVTRSAERFASYAAACAENFEHKRLLLEGERERLAGKHLEAIARFEAAAAEAERAGFVFVRGIALERAGETARAGGLELAAGTYLEAARAHYEALGADGAAASLARRHRLVTQAPAASRGAAATTASTTHVRSDAYDLATVLRAAEALGDARDPGAVVSRLVALVTSSAGAERAVLLLAEGDRWVVAARHGADRGDLGARVDLDAVADASPAALRYVTRTRERVVAPHAALDPRFADEPRVRAGAAASLMAAPLMRRGELVGVVYLEHGAPGVFTPSRASLLEMLAGLGAVAWENARLVSALQDANAGLERQVAARTADLNRALAELWTEMDLATRIQTVLLPEDGRRGAWDVAAVMRPAERVGGDYYDVFEHRGRTWVLVGDVSGHGVNAGLVMMMVQAAVRAVVRALDGDEALSPARLLATVNGALREGLGRIGRGQYMTITAMRLDAEGAVHAGLHQDLVVRRAGTGAVEMVPTRGFWLGIVDDLAPLLVDTPLALGEGDAVVLYTDGVTESRRDDELLGIDPVRDAVAGAGEAPAAVVAAVLATLEGRVVDDDVTVLCVRRG